MPVAQLEALIGTILAEAKLKEIHGDDYDEAKIDKAIIKPFLLLG